MKTKILFIAFFATTTCLFANGIKVIDNSVNKCMVERSMLICEVANATDSDGVIIASASCCRNFAQEPSASAQVSIRLGLIACAEDKLDKELSVAIEP